MHYFCTLIYISRTDFASNESTLRSAQGLIYGLPNYQAGRCARLDALH
jgi:hypothetical protein